MIETFTEYFSQTNLKEIKIVFSGYASKPRTSRISNQKLSLLRAENIQTYFKNEFNKAGLSENIPPWIKTCRYTRRPLWKSI